MHALLNYVHVYMNNIQKACCVLTQEYVLLFNVNEVKIRGTHPHIIYSLTWTTLLYCVCAKLCISNLWVLPHPLHVKIDMLYIHIKYSYSIITTYFLQRSLWINSQWFDWDNHWVCHQDQWSMSSQYTGHCLHLAELLGHPLPTLH